MWATGNRRLGRTIPMILRPATKSDEEAIWTIFRAVIATGDTYVFDPAMSRADALAFWFRPENHVYVTEHGGRIGGPYLPKPNQPPPGAPLAHAPFMVAPSARGPGVGRRLGGPCLAQGRR